MEFLQSYNVSKLAKENNDKLFAYADDSSIIEVYVSMDVLDAHIYRILEGYNEEYEKEDGVYLVESEHIPKLDIAEKILELRGDKSTMPARISSSRQMVDKVIDEADLNEVILATLILDNDNGLANFEANEYYSLDEAIDAVDGGYGIIEL